MCYSTARAALLPPVPTQPTRCRRLRSYHSASGAAAALSPTFNRSNRRIPREEQVITTTHALSRRCKVPPDTCGDEFFSFHKKRMT